MTLPRTLLILMPAWLLFLSGCTIQPQLTEKDFVRMSLDLYYEGRQAELRGDAAAAQDLYERSLLLAPRPLVYYQLGVLHWKERRVDEAREQLADALRLSPNFRQAREALAALEAGQEIMDRAEGERPRLAGPAVQPPPPPAPARVSLREDPAAPAPEPEAISPPPLPRAATAVADAPPDENLREGLRLLEQRNYPDASEWFRQRIQRDPGNPHLHFYLGNALFGQEKFTEAHNSYLQAVQLDPAMARAYVNLGFCQEILGNNQQAEQSYLRAVEASGHPDALYNLGLLYQKRGRFEDAIRYLERYLEAAPAGTPAEEARRQILLMRRELD